MRVLLSLVALTLVPSGFRGGEDIERTLRQLYEGKELILRNFYTGEQLRYGAAGDLLQGGPPGSWTTSGKVAIHRIRLGSRGIEIKGKRIYWPPVTDKKSLKRLHPEVQIEIEVSPEVRSFGAVQAMMNKVFLSPDETLADAAPSYWKAYLRGQQTPAGKQVPPPVLQAGGGRRELPKPPIANKEVLYSIGKEVRAPAALYAPDPPYSEEARRARFSGTSVFSIVVDASGSVRDISVVKPLGLGLDDQAAKTVATWRFKPATRDGTTVAVRMLVEVSFRLY